MDYSCCPFCDLTVPSSALEGRANGHFEEVEDDEVDKQLARDLEFAQQLALAPSSPPSAMKDQAIGELPFWRVMQKLLRVVPHRCGTGFVMCYDLGLLPILPIGFTVEPQFHHGIRAIHV